MRRLDCPFFPWNEPAILLYERVRLRARGPAQGPLRRAGKYVDAILMALRLPNEVEITASAGRAYKLLHSGSSSQDAPPPRVSGFLDPDDAILFPRLTAASDRAVGESTPSACRFLLQQRSSSSKDNAIHSTFVILSGAVDVIDRRPDGDRSRARCREPGTFAADISMFTGEPTSPEARR